MLFCWLFISSISTMPSGNTLSGTDTECVLYILDIDNKLGNKRNTDCIEMPLHKAIDIYTSSMMQLDYRECPEEFVKAFHAHLEAWRDMGNLLRAHDELRGEMHELFDLLKESGHSDAFNKKLDAIWASWDAVSEFTKTK